MGGGKSKEQIVANSQGQIIVKGENKAAKGEQHPQNTQVRNSIIQQV